MNPDRIYREHRDDALADQFEATEYSTFVAMPFRDQFSYHPSHVFESVFCTAARIATARKETKRPFAIPLRVDSGPQIAAQVTEDIIVRILESHFFIGDLTFQNAGVVLETGIALGLKPTNRVILTTQGSPSELHFDINHNRVIQYDADDAIETLATALIGAAQAFEADCDRYVESVKRTLSSEALLALNWYGRIQRDIGPGASLHIGTIPNHFKNWYAPLLFVVIMGSTLSELLSKRLIFTQYLTGVPINEDGALGDAWGSHATDLGWLVIENIWKDLKRPSRIVAS